MAGRGSKLRPPDTSGSTPDSPANRSTANVSSELVDVIYRDTSADSAARRSEAGLVTQSQNLAYELT